MRTSTSITKTFYGNVIGKLLNETNGNGTKVWTSSSLSASTHGRAHSQKRQSDEDRIVGRRATRCDRTRFPR